MQNMDRYVINQNNCTIYFYSISTVLSGQKALHMTNNWQFIYDELWEELLLKSEILIDKKFKQFFFNSTSKPTPRHMGLSLANFYAGNTALAV